MTTNVLTVPKIFKALNEEGNFKQKCATLSYIQTNFKKLESIKAFKESEYADLCRFIFKTFQEKDETLQTKALEVLEVLLRHDKVKNELFKTLCQTSSATRLNVLNILKSLDEKSLVTLTQESASFDFFLECLEPIDPKSMPWLAPDSCMENLSQLLEAEKKTLAQKEQQERNIINLTIALLTKLYTVAAKTSDLSVQRYDIILFDKVLPLAYMGHKGQRAQALEVLQQATETNLGIHIRTVFPDKWSNYKLLLQDTFCKRMSLLVTNCDFDWSLQWALSIQLLGIDLHRGAGLINNLLSVEEKAFKSTDTAIRKQAFISWKLLIDNFAIDAQELATKRRIKLLCIPLNAKNSKTESIAFTKLEVWWHLIIKLYKDIDKFVNPVLIQFLNFCFGPLGDTPLLSSKFDVVASPGKRFHITREAAVDALYQLLVSDEPQPGVNFPIIEERLPDCVNPAIFEESFKSFIHSTGEALLILDQLHGKDFDRRLNLGVTLWTHLLRHVERLKPEVKAVAYKDLVIIVAELVNQTSPESLMRQLLLKTVLKDLASISDTFVFPNESLVNLVSKLTTPTILSKAGKSSYEHLKKLLWQCVKPKPEESYSTNTLRIAKSLLEKVKVSEEARASENFMEVWKILADILRSFIASGEKFNEGNAAEHDFSTVQEMLNFPFAQINTEESKEVQEIAKIWKGLYKEFDVQADLVTTVKPNEILQDNTTRILKNISKNKKSSTLAVYCVDILLNTTNYAHLLSQDSVSPIMKLVTELTVISLTKLSSTETEYALKSLSSILITVFGLNSDKVVSYLLIAFPAIELMLTKTDEPSLLMKEIVNTWETVVSIFRGLHKLLSYELLLSYKTSLLRALNHPNGDISSQASLVLELENEDDPRTKVLLEEISKSVSKSLEAKAKPQVRNVKLAGSFLNRKSSPKVVIAKTKETEKKTAPILPPEFDSQDYVLIKSEFTLDVNRLTEHQKESLKRRRDDIPAMYNDLSQSCSQDSQNLQEWFNEKKKHIEEINKTIGAPKNEDNKENKHDIHEISTSVDIPSVDKNQNNEILPNAKKPDAFEPSEVELTPASKDNEMDNETENVTENVAKKLDFESREEFPDDQQRISPSILESGNRRRGRQKVAVVESPAEVKDESQSSSQAPSQKLGRGKYKRRSLVTPKEATTTATTPSEKILNRSKRKAASDSESESGNVRRRKKETENESGESENLNEKVLEDGVGSQNEELSRRTKNEISRLKIDMFFNTQVESRRRSIKAEKEENNAGTAGTRRQVSPADRKNASKGVEVKTETAKKAESVVEAESAKKTGKNIGKKRGARRSANPEGSAGWEIVKNEELEPKTSGESRTKGRRSWKIGESGKERKNSVEEGTKESPPTDPETVAEQVEDDFNEDVVESSQDSLPSAKLSVEKKKVLEETTSEVEALPVESEGTGTDVDPEAKLEESFEGNASSEETESKVTPEVQKPVSEDTSASKVNQTTTYSSPKSNRNQRFLKMKTFSNQGRAAHMLGLVTKQALIETENQRSEKDTENETVAAKKVKLKENNENDGNKKGFKDATEKIGGGPCGSRQEKIFNNMKSTEYVASPPSKLFSNLKNDGEKVSPKMEKSLLENTSIGHDSDEKDANGCGSPAREEDLPMLEWSSANPPSLTASPSVSILKRHRSDPIPEQDADVTAALNKRKRVSFADPPVSKQMGYETTIESPHKANKLLSRWSWKAPTSRPKHGKSKMIQIEVDKPPEKEEETMIIETIETIEIPEVADSPGEPTKGTPDLEVPTTSSAVDDDKTDEVEQPASLGNCTRLSLDNLAEIEISMNPNTENENVLPKDSILASHELERKNDASESETQQDIFGDVEMSEEVVQEVDDENKDEKLDAEVSELNSGADSIEGHSCSKDESKADSLEDTVDVQNITGLNSTTSSDESFCGKPMRSSTQAQSDAVSEFDTLPVTDSVFASLPLSQDSQPPSQIHAELVQPDLLDSVQPIYPNLINCTESIQSIVRVLANPLWVVHLSTYFMNKDIKTIGDLAQMSEREIVRMPVKGNSKVDFVRSVLKRFESTQSKGTTVTPDKTARTVSASTPLTPTATVTTATGKSTQKDASVDSSPMTQSLSESMKNASHVSTQRETSEKIHDHASLSSIECSSAADEDESNLADEEVSETTGRGSTLTVTRDLNATSSSSDMDNTSATSCDDEIRANNNSPIISAVSIGVSTDSTLGNFPPVKKSTKSVGAQMALEELLDEIDVNLVLQSAARRCTPESMMAQYKTKMRHMPEAELEKETIRMLGLENKQNTNDVNLKTACRASGVNKVLLRLPDIFIHDKEFFNKVLTAYRKKLSVNDCFNVFDFNDIKSAFCQRCTSSELAEMLSKKLKEEETQGIQKQMTELSSLNAMLKRMPMDVIISHTVANDEVIPSPVVLDIALQNNTHENIMKALETHKPTIVQNVFEKRCTAKSIVSHIENRKISKNGLLDILRAISSQMNSREFLDAFHATMKLKLIEPKAEKP